jgi:hypothetical protein
MKRMFTLVAGLLVCLSAGNVSAPGAPEETMTRALNGTTISYNDKASMYGFLEGQLIEATPEPFFEDVASQPSLRDAGADYKATIESVHVTGNIASVVLRETGFGPFNFTDYFHLLKKDGKWQIVSKTFTTE